MNEELSILALIAEAGLLVKGVMLILVASSITSWALIFQRGMVLTAAKRQAREFEDRFWSGLDLVRVFREPSAEKPLSTESIFRAGFKEFNRLRQQNGVDPDALMEGVQRSMRVAVAREQERLEKHLPLLATIGSISPYIGLFGTVWGIMNSFRGLANAQQASLATVAPGISEALIATAIGLFAAIPAVVAYNRYAAQADSILAGHETFADEFSSILHRKVHAKPTTEVAG
ncbi:MAG: protein TolQ [Litorivicinus sp.]